MEKVTGIGGFFFRSNDTKALAEWYERHLGISPVPKGPKTEPWRQEAGVTAFAPFKADSKYFGDMAKQWKINFRVRNMAAMVAQLRAAKIEVSDPETYDGLGSFAQLQDPEGNPIELWEPSP